MISLYASMANYFEFSFELTVDWIFVRAISLYGTITNRNFGRSNPKTVWYNSGPGAHYARIGRDRKSRMTIISCFSLQ